jgi:hypothetical protein
MCTHNQTFDTQNSPLFSVDDRKEVKNMNCATMSLWSSGLSQTNVYFFVNQLREMLSFSVTDQMQSWFRDCKMAQHDYVSIWILEDEKEEGVPGGYFGSRHESCVIMLSKPNWSWRLIRNWDSAQCQKVECWLITKNLGLIGEEN